VTVTKAADDKGKPYVEFRAEANGSYLVWVTAAQNNALRHAETVVVVGEGADENPMPPPDPVPPVPPGKRLVVIIEETTARTPEMAPELTGTLLRDYCQKNGHTYALRDKDQVEANLARFRAPALKIGLPAYFVAVPDGETLKSGSFESAAKLLAILKANGG
jgi:hypothetical protein